MFIDVLDYHKIFTVTWININHTMEQYTRVFLRYMARIISWTINGYMSGVGEREIAISAS